MAARAATPTSARPSKPRPNPRRALAAPEEGTTAMRKPTVAIVLAVVVGLLGAACGKSSSSRTGAASPTTARTPTTAPPALVADLAPTGMLRLAVPAVSPFLAHGSPPAGVGVALAAAL